MRQATKDKIWEAINDLQELGGIKDFGTKEVIKKLKKALEDEEKSKK